MKSTICNLNKSYCQQYFSEQLNGWGNLISLVVKDEVTNNGQFYCFTSDDISEKELYEFSWAKRAGSIPDWPEDYVLRFVYIYLNSLELISPNLIGENPSSDPDHPFIVKSSWEYFLSNQIIFYLKKAGSSLPK